MPHAPPHSFYRQRPPLTGATRSAENRIRELVRPGVGPFFAEAVAGLAAGAAVGIWAGPLSALAGAAIGAVVGAASGLALDYVDTRERLHDARLDKDIGIYGGDIGAGNALDHPLAERGVYSVASVGYAASSGGRSPVEGPFGQPD